MHSYYRRHSLRTKSSNHPPPPKELVRRPRYENDNESIQEERYSRRVSSPRRRAFSKSRDYSEQQDYIKQTEAPVVETGPCRPEPKNNPPNILNERQKALWLDSFSEYDNYQRLGPNTNDVIARTLADDKNQREN